MPFPFFSLRLCASAGKSPWSVANTKVLPQRRGDAEKLRTCQAIPFIPLIPVNLSLRANLSLEHRQKPRFSR